MFASGSSHASSYKDSWICVSQKKIKNATNKECTTKWHALGSDDASSGKKKRNKKYVLQINEIHIDQLVFAFFVKLL